MDDFDSVLQPQEKRGVNAKGSFTYHLENEVTATTDIDHHLEGPTPAELIAASSEQDRGNDDRVSDEVQEAFGSAKTLVLKKIGNSLSISNYRQKLQTLLWWEELATAELKGCSKKYTVKFAQKPGGVKNSRDFRLRLDGDLSHLMYEDEVELKSKRSLDKYYGNITSIDNNVVDFTINSIGLKPGESINLDHNYEVSIKINRRFLSQCHLAVCAFAASSWLKPVMFPSNDIKLCQPLAYTADLILHGASECSLLGFQPQKSQLDAVIGILQSKCRPTPYLVLGAPGTGKTATLVEATLQLHKRKSAAKILVCGSTSSSADVLAMALINSGAIEEHKLVRLTATDWNKQVDTVVRSITKDMIGLRDEEKRGVEHSVYVTTCRQSAILTGRTFDLVLVDEAQRATEPETLIPLTLMKPNGAAVLAGDPNLPGPNCISKDASKFGLGASMLERLSKCEVYRAKGPNAANSVARLSVCFRCDKRLMRVNKRFYASRFPFTKNFLFCSNKLDFVHVSPSEWLKRFGLEEPLIFVNLTESRQAQWINNGQISTEIEALTVMKLVRKFYDLSLSSHMIGVATPNRVRADRLRSIFERNGVPLCKIDTVENFQGDERKVMIITTHDDEPNSEFFKDRRWFNLATSRSRWMSLVIGNPRELKNVQSWRDYVRVATEVDCDLHQFGKKAERSTGREASESESHHL